MDRAGAASPSTRQPCCGASPKATRTPLPSNLCGRPSPPHPSLSISLSLSLSLPSRASVLSPSPPTPPPLPPPRLVGARRVASPGGGGGPSLPVLLVTVGTGLVEDVQAVLGGSLGAILSSRARQHHHSFWSRYSVADPRVRFAREPVLPHPQLCLARRRRRRRLHPPRPPPPGRRGYCCMYGHTAAWYEYIEHHAPSHSRRLLLALATLSDYKSALLLPSAPLVNFPIPREPSSSLKHLCSLDENRPERAETLSRACLTLLRYSTLHLVDSAYTCPRLWSTL